MMLALVLVAVALAGVALVEVVTRRPVVGAALVLGSVVWSAFFQNLLGNINIGPLSVTTGDIVFMVVVGGALARMLRLTEFTPATRCLITISLLVLLSVVQGAAVHGVEPAIREGRATMYFYGVALYFSTVSWNDMRDRIGNVWLIAAAALLAIALLRWGVLLAGLPPTGVWTRTREAGGMRVIDNRNTLVVAQALFLVIPFWVRGAMTRFQRRLLYIAVPSLLLLQHRTIWLIIAVGVLVTISRTGLVSRAVDSIAIAVFVGLGVLAMATMAEDVEVVERAPADTETLDWRVQSWVGLVEAERPGIQRAIGEPYGSGYERTVNGNRVEIIPHNFYVDQLVRIGVVGTGLFVALYWYLLARLHRTGRTPVARRDTSLLTADTLIVLLSTQVAYYLPWDPGPEQGIILGLAISACRSLGRAAPVGTGASTSTDVALSSRDERRRVAPGL